MVSKYVPGRTVGDEELWVETAAITDAVDGGAALALVGTRAAEVGTGIAGEAMQASIHRSIKTKEYIDPVFLFTDYSSRQGYAVD